MMKIEEMLKYTHLIKLNYLAWKNEKRREEKRKNLHPKAHLIIIVAIVGEASVRSSGYRMIMMSMRQTRVSRGRNSIAVSRGRGRIDCRYQSHNQKE